MSALTNPATVSPQRSLLSKDETLTAYGTEFFSMNDVNRLRILQDVIDRRLTTRLAATRLEISDRHCRRLLERCREHGPLSLVNRRRDRQLMPGLAERALRIIRERYADFGPTLACEKLAEIHDLYLAKETVRKLMTRDGLWIPRKLRPPRMHQPRPRRACTGELIQIDGSEHRWFGNCGSAVSAHLRLKTPLLMSSWKITTVGLQSRHVTILMYIASWITAITCRRHSPGASSVRSRKT
ncbi:transposase [Raoultella terrigena]|uniref:Transposase n=1 Tax=Raoultella terrigena TaxID=577 RepID=A0A7Z8ZA71_RAOTE|nr:transposase [Raoultella terrigena]